MANQEHLDLLKQGVEVWNHWRKEHRHVQPDLSGADLAEIALSDARLSFSRLKEAQFRQAHLYRAYFVRSDLSGANLREALLLEAHLDHANLAGANLSGTQLQHAKIRFANLSGANLSGADLRFTTLDGARFSSAHLHGSDLSFARVRRAAFDHVDLSTAKGLETMIHQGPSLLGLHTFALSYQSLPETFLEGTGVTETLLAAARAGGNMLGHRLEDHLTLDDAFLLALTRGFRRFMQFAGAQELDGVMLSPEKVRVSVLERIRM